MQELKMFKLFNISIHLYCGDIAHQSIFPYNIIEIPITSLAHNSVFIGSNNFKFSTDIKSYSITGHVKVSGTLIVICMIMLFMTSYANHQF